MILIRWLKSIKRSFVCERVLKADIRRYKKHYVTSPHCQINGSKEARDILVFCHVVEKGLSHKKIKPLFGYERVSYIGSSLENYVRKGGTDSYIINMALSTLNKYNAVNKEMGVATEKLISMPQIDGSQLIDIGTDTISAEDFFAASKSTFSEMAKARRSVRLYDCKSSKIEKEELLKCIKIAQNCPSACNRQAVRVKIILDDNKIKKISEAQGGSSGFGENAGAFLAITTDISLYQPDERRIPMLDCGIFVMNLVYALYENGLGTCVLNGSFTKERENRVKQVISLPDNEMFATIIAVSKIPQDEIFKVAHSCKRDVNDIVTFI